MSFGLVQFLITAAVFTGLGAFMGYSVKVNTITKSLITLLAERGYLRYHLKEDGEYEILKIDGTKDDFEN